MQIFLFARSPARAIAAPFLDASRPHLRHGKMLIKQANALIRGLHAR